MKKQSYLGALALAVLLLAAGISCTPRVQEQVAATPAAPTRTAAAPVSKNDWEVKWEKVVEAGKKEGIVNAYAFWPKEVMTGLTSAFKSRYGITLEFTVQRGSELLPKVQAEKRAGLNLVDVYGQGATTLITNVKAAGYLGQIEPLLILPEVLDAKAWRSGQIPFADKAHQVIQVSAIPQKYMIYNTTLVKPEELKSYEDVLNPKFKGKLNLYDPSISGTGSSLLAHLGYNLWTPEKANDFLKRLITEQEVFITRDYRVQTETVARGKYYIGLGAQASAAIEFVTMGAAIDAPPIKQVSITSEAGNVGVPDVSPHPNATTVFVNWLLSKEGQTVFSRTIGTPVMRADVSVEEISPIMRLAPDDKVYMETEDFRYFKDQMQKTMKDIIDTYSK